MKLRTACNVLAAIIFAAIAIPLLTFSRAQWSDPLEKRVSAQMPAAPHRLSDLAEFLKQFEAYFGDHLGQRSALIDLRQYIDVYLFQRSPTSLVLIGKDDWLFFTGDHAIDDYRGRQQLSAEQLDSWYRTLKQRHDALAAQGIAYRVVFAPNKHSIYPEFMPDSVKRGRTTQLDQLLAYVKAKGDLDVLDDLRPALIAHKAEGPLYGVLDVHWNRYGAYFGYRTFMEDLLERNHVTGVHLLQLGLRDFHQVETRFGDMALMMHFNPYLRDTLTFQYAGPELACSHTQATVPPRVTMARGTPDRAEMTIDCAQPGRTARLMMFHDSMSEAMYDYITNSFGHVRLTWTYPDSHDIACYVAAEKPDVVIEERSERGVIAAPNASVAFACN